jgi:hypothetical protein
MAKDRRKIEKKRKKDAAKAKKTAAYAAAKKREATRPRVTVDPTGGDLVFVRRVQAAVADISLEESGGCPPDVAEVVARCMRDDPEEVCTYYRVQAALKSDDHNEIVRAPAVLFHTVASYVGSRVFEQLPEVYQKKLLPDYAFFPLIAPEGVCIRFGFLDRVKRSTGWGYYSQHKPTVTINGAKWIVCFSDHAIERIVERSSFEEQITYSHYMDCMNYFDGCVHFEPVTMGDGKPAIRLFMNDGLAGNHGRYRDYIQKITGTDEATRDSSGLAYVLGYCHVDCKGQFAKATSMWYPGYNGTPEDVLVRTSGLGHEEKRRLLEMADGNKTVRVVNDGRHEAIRWYHENGVPQVVPLARKLFDWAPHLTRATVSKILPQPGQVQ